MEQQAQHKTKQKKRKRNQWELSSTSSRLPVRCCAATKRADRQGRAGRVRDQRALSGSCWDECWALWRSQWPRGPRAPPRWGPPRTPRRTPAAIASACPRSAAASSSASSCPPSTTPRDSAGACSHMLVARICRKGERGGRSVKSAQGRGARRRAYR